MNDDLLSSDQEVEHLVQAYLDDDARTVDAEQMLARVRTAVATETIAASASFSNVGLRAPTRWRRRRGWGVGLAAAASLLFVAFWSMRTTTVKADAFQVVREAHAILNERVDRAYRIRLELTPGSAERHPILAVMASSRSTLRTRGDRYWIEISQSSRSWAFGRDETRHVWLAPGPKVGLIFEPREIPESLAMVQDFHSLDLDLLMTQLLTEFDLEPAEAETGRTAGVTRIRAHLKPNRKHLPIASVTLEIDNRTKLVREVIISRKLRDKVAATVLYTFEKTDRQPDERYRLEGHVDPDAAISGANERRTRRRELMLLFGSFLVSET